MHDCPNCAVPLHGYEEKCPKCGAKQFVRKTFQVPDLSEQPKFNFVPIIIVGIILAAGFFFMAKSSWIGELMSQGPKVENPMDKLTYLDARKIIQDKITQGLSAVGTKGNFTWKSGDTKADMTVNQPLELDVATSLSNPDQRKEIIDPIKDYMPKANIPTLIMTDSRSHATWTYSVAPLPESSNDVAKPQQ